MYLELIQRSDESIARLVWRRIGCALFKFSSFIELISEHKKKLPLSTKSPIYTLHWMLLYSLLATISVTNQIKWLFIQFRMLSSQAWTPPPLLLLPAEQSTVDLFSISSSRLLQITLKLINSCSTQCYYCVLVRVHDSTVLTNIVANKVNKHWTDTETRLSKR